VYLRFLKYLFLILSIFLSGCADKSRWATRVEWPALTFSELPDQDDFPDEGAVVIYDEGKMEIFSSGPTGFSEFERHKIIKILNIRGEKYANVMIPYFPGVTLDQIQARTISPSGKISVLDSEEIYDVTLYPNFVFYSDQRAKILTLPAIEPGSVVEYRYQVSIRGRTLWHSWVFQDEIPTLLSRFTLIHPSEWRLNFKLYNLDIKPIEDLAPLGFKATRIWEAKNLPPLKSEYGMPARRNSISRLSFAPNGVENWDDVALWYHQLASDRTDANEDMKKLALQLTQGLSSEQEKLKTLYEWVRDNVRYIAVEIGIGGYQPYPATEVFENLYGDCKDMTTLLCGLSEAAGIRVDEVLISTWQNGELDTALASPFQFDHAIAYCPAVGDGGIWMDATDKGCEFGKLPWYDQGLPVLVIGNAGEGILMKTPRDSSGSNKTCMNWQVTLQPDGSAQVQSQTHMWGAMASEMRADLRYASKDEMRKWLEMHVARRSAVTSLDTFQVPDLGVIKDPLTIEYSFHTSHFVRKRADKLILQPGMISLFDLPNWFRSPSREHPVQLRFPFEQEHRLQIQLPDSFQVNRPVFQDSIISEFGHARWNWSVAGEILNIQVNYTLKKTMITEPEYQDFREFLSTIQEKDLWEVILVHDKLQGVNP